MGAILLNIVVTFAFQSPQSDTSLDTSATPGIAFERLSDLLQYNRVQGLSLGLGTRLPVPGVPSVVVYTTVRYGLSDERVTGRLTAIRSGAESRLSLSAYQDIADLDPFSHGRTLGNSLNGLLVGHDNGDYALERGAAARLERTIPGGMEVVLTGQVERVRSIMRVARSEVNDFLGGTGLFPQNPPVLEGTFAEASAQVRRSGRTRWTITADALAGSGQTTARLYGDVRRGFGTGLGLTARIKAGAATRPTAPQSLFRLGGLNTVRGFEYGTTRAPVFWATQLDLTLFRGRVRPVLFVDAGQAATLSNLLSSAALVGGGIGLSLFSGLIRFDLSRPLSPDRGDKLRLDLVIQGAR
ncbi:MAG TPA: hypothetical protein VJ808_11310 [Gemmatimonadales bacterium]|nr:hypothetical protein [Gemmatimonadales bacterium]